MKKYVHKGRLPKGQGSTAMAVRISRLRRDRTCQICNHDLNNCLGHQSLVTMPSTFVGRRYGIITALTDVNHTAARVVKATQDDAIAALKEQEAAQA